MVKCNIPLLISSEILEEWEADQSYKNRTIRIGITGETFQLEKLRSGHFGINLQMEPNNPHLKNCFFGIHEDSSKTKYKNVQKVHRTLGHPSKEKLTSLYKNSGSLTRNLKIIINKVVDL